MRVQWKRKSKRRYDIFHRENRGFEFNAGFIAKEVESTRLV